jgi:outer membrane protein assembly factor BamE (lipoprotein component of BamABCDE complex)
VDKQGEQAQKDVSSDGGPDSGGAPAPAPAPASVELGQTPDQVKSALGAPTRVANLGNKTIYYYNGMKVTFNNGKVSDVQ